MTRRDDANLVLVEINVSNCILYDLKLETKEFPDRLDMG